MSNAIETENNNAIGVVVETIEAKPQIIKAKKQVEWPFKGCWRTSSSRDEDRFNAHPPLLGKSSVFFLQAFGVWLALCVPGNVVTGVLYHRVHANLAIQVSNTLILIQGVPSLMNK